MRLTMSLQAYNDSLSGKMNYGNKGLILDGNLPTSAGSCRAIVLAGDAAQSFAATPKTIASPPSARGQIQNGMAVQKLD